MEKNKESLNLKPAPVRLKNSLIKMKPHTMNAKMPFVLLLSFCLLAAHEPVQAQKTNLTNTITNPRISNLSTKTPRFEKIIEDLNKEEIIHLSHLKGQVKDDDIQDSIRFGRAVDLLEKNHAQAALATLNKIHSHFILIEYRNYYKARALLALKDYKKALASLTEKDNFVTKIGLETFWLKMEILAQLKETKKLEQELIALGNKRPKDEWIKIKSAYYLGLNHWIQGDKTNAIRQFAKILVERPGTELDEVIFSLLETKGVSKFNSLSQSQWNSRAEKLVENGFAHMATEIWKKLYEKSSSQQKYYKNKIAYGTFKEKRYKTAAKLYEELLSTQENSSSKLEVWITLSKAYGRYDNFPKAIEINEKIIKEFPQTQAASFASSKLGFLYFDSGNYDKAISYFEPYLNQGSRSQKENAHWYCLWSYYLSGQLEKALTEIDQYATLKTKNKEQLQMLAYWKGRIFEKLKKTEEAKQIYKTILGAHSLDYYSLLAKQRITNSHLDPRTLISLDQLNFVPTGIKQDDIQSISLKTISSDDPLIKAILLFQLGMDNFAFDESKTSSYTHLQPDLNLSHAIQLSGNFRHGYGVRKMAMAGKLSGISSVDAFQLAFPQAYKKYVSPYSQLWGIDENIVYAVMRQESAFTPEAFSYAFAHGLMQIIPPTAKEIAEKIHCKGFTMDALRTPIINTLFGTYYFSHVLDSLEQNMIYAIAAYNAGPQAVRRWKNKANNWEMDEFIELIPYSQTKDYVKKVLVNYLVYQRVYKGAH